MLTAKKRKIISIVSGIIAAGFFLLFAGRLSSQVQAETHKAVKRFGAETVWVLTAKDNIKEGELITEENTKLALWASVLLSAEAIDKDHISQAINHRANTLILAGEPLVKSRFIKNQHKLDSLPEGFSAVTIEMNSVRALGGEVEVGMHVTVLSTQGAQEAQLLAPNVAVLSTSTQKDTDKSKSVLGGSATGDIAWITLAVPDSLVAELVSAASTNNTYLVMPDDAEVFLRAYKKIKPEESFTKGLLSEESVGEQEELSSMP